MPKNLYFSSHNSNTNAQSKPQPHFTYYAPSNSNLSRYPAPQKSMQKSSNNATASHSNEKNRSNSIESKSKPIIRIDGVTPKMSVEICDDSLEMEKKG